MLIEKVYLKENLLAEPLVNQWYAWSGLISPPAASMYISFSHIKTMQSFVEAPQVHVAALDNPAMIGGPFINHKAASVGKIRALLDRTRKEQAHMLKLGEAIRDLNQQLLSEATGFSLEPLYHKVPDVLRGYVELTYDINDHFSIRFIEALMYKSKYYNEASQSIALSLIHEDHRPFIFSTPRLEEDGLLHVRMPFSSKELDELFKMKGEAQPLGRIKEMLGVEAEDEELFSTFFTVTPPRRPEKYNEDKLRIRYFGHACLLLETAETTILCDPVISYNHGNGINRYTYADLPDRIDYVLITHNHQDHCMFETLLQLRHKIGNLIIPKGAGGTTFDPSLKLVLQNIGFKGVIEIDELESISVEGGEITGLPFLGEHADLGVRTKIAYLITLNGKSVLCAADSNNIEPKLYEYLSQVTKSVDVLFLGMECDGAPLGWIYGPYRVRPLARKMSQSRRLNGSNYERAIQIVDQLKPKEVYVYAMGQEPWMTFVTAVRYTEQSYPITESNKLIEECRSRGIVSERLFGFKEIL